MDSYPVSFFEHLILNSTSSLMNYLFSNFHFMLLYSLSQIICFCIFMTYVLLAVGNERILTFTKDIVKCQENNRLCDTFLYAYLAVKEEIKNFTTNIISTLWSSNMKFLVGKTLVLLLLLFFGTSIFLLYRLIIFLFM